MTTPTAQTVVSAALPPVGITAANILNNNYLFAASQQAVANQQAALSAAFQHQQHLHQNPFHQAALQALQVPIAAKSPLTKIKSIITSSPTATIPTQLSFVTTSQPQIHHHHQQQLQKSINTQTSVSTSSTAINNNNSVSTNAVLNQTNQSSGRSETSTPNNNNHISNNKMDNPGGQLIPMTSNPLSQSMDSVNTASNEEEVSRFFILLCLFSLELKIDGGFFGIFSLHIQ